MTRKQFWKTMGQAFETPEEERTNKQNGITQEGLCSAIPPLESKETKKFQYRKLLQLFSYDLKAKDILYAWLPCKNNCQYIGQRKRSLKSNHTHNHNRIRAMFCYLLASMSKDDYEKLGKE